MLEPARLDGDHIGRYLSILEDASGAHTIDRVRSPALASGFVPSHSDIPGYGMSRSAYWLRFDVENPGAEPIPWLLEVSYPPLDDVQLYVPGADGRLVLRHTGDTHPFSTRDMRHRTFLFSLNEAPGVHTYYLRVQSTGTVTLPIRVWTPISFIENLMNEQPLLWIFYGLMLVMAVYNLFIYFSVRETSYLFYVCYIVSYIGVMFVLNGFGSQYLWSSFPWWNSKALLIFLFCSFASGIAFQRQFLRLAERLPAYDKISKLVIAFMLFMCALSPIIEYGIGIRVLAVSGLLTCVFVLTTSVVAALQRSRSAFFYLASWIALLAGALCFIFRAIGLMEDHFFSVWGPQLGAALETTLLSLGLADRINSMRGNLQSLNHKLLHNVEQLTVALEQAESAKRAKAEFLASVSHELRTPLNAIINIPEGLIQEFHAVSGVRCGNCRALFELEHGEHADLQQPCPECAATAALELEPTFKYEGDPQASVRRLGSIHKASKHLLGVVSSILDISKLEAQRMELHLTEVDLSELMAETLPPLKALAETKGVTLTLVACAPESRLRADSVRVAQIVVNLVGNAIKFSDGRGEVRVQVDEEPGAYVLRVHDQGIGIHAADQSRIFEHFSQVDSSNTRKFGGTGLGLAITKNLVELHGGTIWVDSELGRGSTFSVRLPKTGPSGAGSAPHPDPNSLPATSALAPQMASLTARLAAQPEAP